MVSCKGIKTTQDLDDEYTMHLDYFKEDYQSKIDYYNTLSTRTVLSVVKIEKTSYSPYSNATGSGVIFTQDDTYFYILTNSHVTYTENSERTTYMVNDYQGNNYSAVLVATDSSYDLSVLRINKRSLIIDNMVFSTHNASIGVRTAILGYPVEQANVITLGEVLSYQEVSIEDALSNVVKVEFPVMITNTPVKPGSSGSVVVNERFQLVGILYAGTFSESGLTSLFAFSIPVEKVIEFLIDHDFTYEEESS
jgi:S1-C subfamily serine protease